MKRPGIAGAQAFDANQTTPQIVDQRLVYMTPAWKDAFRFAATEAERLGLELAIAGFPGWSETGGPWVPPQDRMKKLVWSEALVRGGRSVTTRLASPPATTGPFGDAPLQKHVDVHAKAGPQFYRDIAVLAYPVAATPQLPGRRLSASKGTAVDLAPATDNSLATFATLDADTAEAPTTVLLDFAAPLTIRSATLFVPGAAGRAGGGPLLRLENGLKVYGEALENGRPSLGDDMTLRSHADYPMGGHVVHPARSRADPCVPGRPQGRLVSRPRLWPEHRGR